MIYKSNRLIFLLLDPLMLNGPWSMLSILACYLLFVNKIGPQLMKDREPFQLRGVLLAHNIILVILNSYFFVESLICLRFGLSLLNFDFPDRSDTSAMAMRMINSAYLYFLTKFVDLFDTVFFVMRKKYNQVSHEKKEMNLTRSVQICLTCSNMIKSVLTLLFSTGYCLASLSPHSSSNTRMDGIPDSTNCCPNWSFPCG